MHKKHVFLRSSLQLQRYLILQQNAIIKVTSHSHSQSPSRTAKGSEQKVDIKEFNRRGKGGKIIIIMIVVKLYTKQVMHNAVADQLLMLNQALSNGPPSQAKHPSFSVKCDIIDSGISLSSAGVSCPWLCPFPTPCASLPFSLVGWCEGLTCCKHCSGTAETSALFASQIQNATLYQLLGRKLIPSQPKP